MKINYSFFLLFLFGSISALSQNSIDINALFDTEKHSIAITQTIRYQNKSNTPLDTIYLNDWSHSYSSKTTPLAERFADEFKTTFHFAGNEDRGFTVVTSIKQSSQDLFFQRLKGHPDVIKVALNRPLAPNEYYDLTLNYIVQIPNNKFTRYGVTGNSDYNLRFWYITPAVFDGQWHYYSNKDLEDLFVEPANISLKVTYPNNFTPISELDLIENKTIDSLVYTEFKGENRINTKLSLVKTNDYNTVETDFFNIQSNIDDEDLDPTKVAILSDKVAQFITTNLGDYPHKKVLLTWIDYKKDPIYGLNLLPDFIRPFEDTFQYELKLLKTTLKVYLENTLLINPREEQWLLDAIQIYYLRKYVEDFYPNQKILGKLADVWGVRAFHASDLKFNDQYPFLYMHMARTNIDQPIGMAKDSLLKFNKNISNKYKAAIGLNYLNDFVGDTIVDKTLSDFIKQTKLKRTTPEDFKSLITSKTDKDLNWFFDDYVKTSKKIDFKIKRVKKTEDSITITLKNLRDNTMPISLFTLENDSITSKQWIDGFSDTKKITIANKDVDQLALNYDYTIPEFNQRNNYKKLDGFFLTNKPLQFRLFKDIEDPNYNQVFFMPEFEYNFYDGLSPGLKLYNKTLLSKRFLYKISPKFGFKSKQVVGSASLIYNARPEDSDNYRTRYGLSGNYYNYAPNLTYTSFTPFIDYNFRNHKNLRDNKRKFLSFRYVNINREIDATGEFETTGEPKYSVFNAKFGVVDNNLKEHASVFTDLQLAKDFGKISATLEFRNLNTRNKQFNVRVFSGLFLYNNSYQDSDFFSFALDRPTDYLFDYNYLGRSEQTGLLSQQLIIADGGFKSKLTHPFANQWMTTVNTSATLWRYIMLYGDAGVIKNKNFSPEFVYDSGIRLNLVEDYFELYFPLYSNLGWEIGQPNYDEKIRFIVTLSPKTLLGLFTRRWY
ncbi:metalloprotease [Olleya sp. HaHaR_3_96]|uniref:metalloprotease n=1 Tax=Olleya sp. HaHaR_3_96 TaxID=2745560 RepID=UPI001C4E6452|nr:metalloprotease [Olleya sp. HaHaR_3_96]QXP59408.1 metalloprotease [Olleya sp. HaHaR_3_96]